MSRVQELMNQCPAGEMPSPIEFRIAFDADISDAMAADRMMQQRARENSMWAKIKKFFHDSEVIFWARLQVVLGVAGASIMSLASDPNINGAVQSILKPEYVPYYVIGFGFLTEILRRRRATDL